MGKRVQTGDICLIVKYDQKGEYEGYAMMRAAEGQIFGQFRCDLRYKGYWVEEFGEVTLGVADQVIIFEDVATAEHAFDMIGQARDTYYRELHAASQKFKLTVKLVTPA